MDISGGEQDNDIAKWRTPCIPHSANHAMVTLFTLYLMRAIANPGKYLEFSIESGGINDEARAMFAPVFEIENGSLNLPAEPGWGITIHPDWLKKAD